MIEDVAVTIFKVLRRFIGYFFLENNFSVFDKEPRLFHRQTFC